MSFPLVQLGTSDLHVTPICLGTMTFGEQVNEADSHAILDRSLARGVNFIDTAEMYAVPAKAETCGATETIIGNWFAKHPGARQKLVLATKVAGPSRGMPWVREGSGMSTQDMEASCEGSLRRLKTDVIDLYQIHWPERHVPAFGMAYYDPTKENSATPIHEQLDALNKLVKAGKVRYIGSSTAPGWHVATSVLTSERLNIARIVSEQSPYNLLDRRIENELVPACQAHGVGVICWSPLAMGMLAGRYEQGRTGDSRAALRGGIKTVLIPEENIKDLQEIPDNVKANLEIVPVRWLDKVLEIALERMPTPIPEEEVEVPVAAKVEVVPTVAVKH